MFSDRSASAALVLSLALTSAGCASTSLNSEWSPDAQPQQFERITTALMVSDVGLRRAFEERVSAKAGERFVPSLDLLFPGKTYEEGEVLSILEENGVDGVLLVTVQDAGASEAYIPGSGLVCFGREWWERLRQHRGSAQLARGRGAEGVEGGRGG